MPRRRSRNPTASGRQRASYTKEQVIQAIQRWVFLHEEPPRMIDWDPARARRQGQAWRAERFEAGEWPTARIVTRRFPSFNAAIETAGLSSRPAPSRRRPNLSGPQVILDALVEWTRRYGDVPTMADWDPVRAERLGQEWRIGRYYHGDWPSARSVATHFGSFAHAAAAAGLVARPPHAHHDRREAEQRFNRRVAAKRRVVGRAPGHADVARCLRALARARADEDPVALHASLIDLAGAALAWAELSGSD